MDTPGRIYDLAVIGNYTKDTIVTAAGVRHVDGGGFNYAAHAAVLTGARVAAITRLAAEDSQVVEALERIGVDVLAEITPDSTLMRLEYPTDNPDQRILTVAATAGSYTVQQVLKVAARAYVVSPSFRGEVPLEVIRALGARDSMLAVDVQGFGRTRSPDGRLHHEEWPEMAAVLQHIDILKADAVEAASLTGLTDVAAAAEALAEFGPREIVLTHRDGLLVLADGERHETEFHPDELRGRSGRGDTCLGSYTAKRLSAPPAEATLWAAALTSLKMEAEGPILRGVGEVEDLLERKYGRAAG